MEYDYSRFSEEINNEMVNVVKLDGVWDFSFDDRSTRPPETLPEIVWETGLSVPGCFDVTEPRLGKRGVGFYRRIVRTGGWIRLSVDGVGVEATLFWDGRLIGRCKHYC